MGTRSAPRSEPSTPGPTVAARMNRLPITRTHRMATVAVGLGLFFDFYEIFLTSVLSAVLVGEFHLNKAQLPAVLASTFVGMFLGAVLLGRLADRFGRRGAFLAGLGTYSLFSLLGAFSGGPWMLLGSRFLAGVGLGAEPALADAYLSDLLPARRRGRYIAWAYTLSFLGVPTVGFLGHALVSLAPLGFAGWRWMFVLGSLGALVVALLRGGLPESPRWLESVGRNADADAIASRFEAEATAAGHTLAEPAADPVPPSRVGRLRDLLRPPHRRRAGMMTGFHLLQTFGYYGFGTLVPLVLAAKGYPVVQSLLFTAVTFLGYPIGSALSLPLVERFERKYLVIGSCLAMAALGVGFGYAGSTATVLVLGFAYTAVSNVFSNAFHIYQAEIFPTSLRSTAAGSTYALSRLSTAAMPFVLVPLLDHAGASALFAVVAAAMVAIAVDIGAFGPHTTGRALEEVNAETGDTPAVAAGSPVGE
ncbi:MFS transporter [Gandjariella thermophila]|uniref:MFS transporter n=1 Tax=Gandjariella thermophila TaxID=1931992 RepID=A0A4D4J4A1_9PSEU|nr:MFS transporter [Gandjariella thermophila]GDY28783.1 MFS transporter [Gandjariella thermophila]